MNMYIERSLLVCSMFCRMSRIDSFWNLSPLYTTVSKNVISFSEISAVNFIVGWNVLACSMNRSMSCLLTSHRV